MGSLVEGNNGGFTMPVQPMCTGMGGYGAGNGYGYGNDWWFLLVFLALIFNGNWGTNGRDNGGNGGSGVMPYLIGNATNNDVQRGFDQQAVVSGINGLSNDICNLQQTIGNGFANAETAANSRQMADMNQLFGVSTQINNNANAIQSQLAQCCCDNQLATANLTSTILAENCADRTALADSTRDIITTVNNGVQRIADIMCNNQIAAKDEKIAELQNSILLSNINNNIKLQTEQMSANNLAQTQALEQYLAPKANPAYIVNNPYTSPIGYGYGNGCGSCCGGTYGNYYNTCG